MQPDIRVQSADFHLQTEYEALLAQGGNIGAVVAFSGLVRDRDTAIPLASVHEWVSSNCWRARSKSSMRGFSISCGEL